VCSDHYDHDDYDDDHYDDHDDHDHARRHDHDNATGCGMCAAGDFGKPAERQ
jgi:hypothetical protein